MNKTEITLSMEAEKLNALAYFLAKENTTPQKTLAKMLEELYQAHVPEAMREYIESRNAPSAAARPRSKRPAKPARKNDENVVVPEVDSNGEP